MTTLALNKMWLNRMDTGEGIAGASARNRSTSYAMDGEVRKYASGRLRAITTAGVKVEVPRTFLTLDFATKEKLLTWVGMFVQLRDDRGGKWYGVFFSADVTELMRPDLYSVTVTLHVTTTGEGT